MNEYSLFAGIFMTIAGSCGLLRHFLLEPKVLTYPRAPSWLLSVFFFTSAVFIFIGTRYLAAWVMNEPGTPPNASPMAVFLAGTLLVYKAALLGNLLRQHYPAPVWARLNAINEKVRCSEGCWLFTRRK